MALAYKDIKVGDKLKIKKLDNGISQYGYKIGQIVTVTYNHANTINIQDEEGILQQVNVTLGSLEALSYTKEEIEKDIKELEVKIKSLKDKLAWMKKTGNTEYDETEFTVWQTLETIDSNASQADKAKAIAKLIKGK